MDEEGNRVIDGRRPIRRWTLGIGLLIVALAGTILLIMTGVLAGGCSLIGCESAIDMSLSDDLPPGVYGLEACVDEETCTTTTFEITGQSNYEVYVSFDEAEFAQDAMVVVTVTDSAGSVAAGRRGEVTFERSQPNGWLCPPICWWARMSV